MHPLVNDLTTLTDEELAAKISDLSKRLTQSYRLGYGDAIQQIQMFLFDYQAERQRRNEKLLADLDTKSKEFKNIIDVG